MVQTACTMYLSNHIHLQFTSACHVTETVTSPIASGRHRQIMAQDAALCALAQQLQAQLKQSRGPKQSPQIAYIMCAILVERDGIGCRAACRMVEG